MHTLSCHDLESLSAGPIGESSVVLFQPPEAWLCSRDWPSQDLDFSLLHYSILHGFEFPFSCMHKNVGCQGTTMHLATPSITPVLGKICCSCRFQQDVV